MDKKILNEINRNRELMGLNESEVNEQGFIDAVKTGINKGKEFASKKEGTLSYKRPDGLTTKGETIDINYVRGPKFTEFHYDTGGAINGHFTLDTALEKLGLSKVLNDPNKPNYYKGTRNNIATYKIPNEEIPETFFGEDDKSDQLSKPENFTIEYNDKSYVVDFNTLTDNTTNGYFDVDGVRFYYGIGKLKRKSQFDATQNKIKDKEGVKSSVTKVDNNDDGSVTTQKLDRVVTNTTLNDSNRLNELPITPSTFNLGDGDIHITVGV